MSEDFEQDISFSEDEDANELSRMKGKSEQKLRKELASCHEEKTEYLDGWQRAKADLINFKKEAEESNAKTHKFATEDFISQLLPVIDSFEMALAHTEDRGVQQIHSQLLSILKSNGVEQVDPIGEVFDPSQHESIEMVEVENKKDEDTIVEVVQKGYKIDNKIIRAPKVKVGELTI